MHIHKVSNQSHGLHRLPTIQSHMTRFRIFVIKIHSNDETLQGLQTKPYIELKTEL